MEITEDTPERLVVSAQRHPKARAFVLAIGALGLIALAIALVGGGMVALAFGAVFVGLSTAALILDCDTCVSFDAGTETATIERQRRIAPVRRSLSFHDILAVTEYQNEDSQTVHLRLVTGKPIPLEMSYTKNPNAAHIAARIQRWLNDHARRKPTTT